MQFSVCYGSRWQRHKWLCVFRVHFRDVSRGSILPSCNNHHSLLSNRPPSSTHCLQIDLSWTLSGFPSSNAGHKCFSFVPLFEQLSAPTFSSSPNDISGSRQSPWLVLLLRLTLKACCSCRLSTPSAETRPRYWYATHTSGLLLGEFLTGSTRQLAHIRQIGAEDTVCGEEC